MARYTGQELELEPVAAACAAGQQLQGKTVTEDAKNPTCMPTQTSALSTTGAAAEQGGELALQSQNLELSDIGAAFLKSLGLQVETAAAGHVRGKSVGDRPKTPTRKFPTPTPVAPSTAGSATGHGSDSGAAASEQASKLGARCGGCS